jgi:hypothetical protein
MISARWLSLLAVQRSPLCMAVIPCLPMLAMSWSWFAAESA